MISRYLNDKGRQQSKIILIPLTTFFLATIKITVFFLKILFFLSARTLFCIETGIIECLKFFCSVNVTEEKLKLGAFGRFFIGPINEIQRVMKMLIDF